MSDLLKEIKRNRKFILFEVIFFIVTFFVYGRFFSGTFGTIASIAKSRYAFGLAFDWYGTLLSENALYAAAITVCICMILRTVIYDSGKQQLFKASVPLSPQTESLFDLLNGYVPIVLSVIVMQIFKSLIFSYYPEGKLMGFDFLSFLKNVLFSENIWFPLFLYTMIVLAKRVSSSGWSMLLCYIVFTTSLLWAYTAIGDYFFFNHIETPFSVALAAGYLFVILTIAALIFANRTLDRAKGGAFYFLPVQILVSFGTAILIYGVMMGFFDIVKMRNDVLPGIISIAVAAAVTAGEVFLTKSHVPVTRK